MKKPPNFQSVLLALLVPMTACGGIIEVTGMKKGSQAIVHTFDENGKFIAEYKLNDSDNNGASGVQINHQDRVRQITIFKLDGNGVRQKENGKFKTMSLLAAEPFQLPSFLPTDPSLSILVQFDFDAFLAQPNPFTAGQTLAVNAGVIGLSTALTFKDPTSLAGLSPEELVDPTLFDSLPAFTGNVVVGPYTTFNLVPEPDASSSALVSLGLFGAFLLFHRRRTTASGS